MEQINAEILAQRTIAVFRFTSLFLSRLNVHSSTVLENAKFLYATNFILLPIFNQILIFHYYLQLLFLDAIPLIIPLFVEVIILLRCLWEWYLHLYLKLDTRFYFFHLTSPHFHDAHWRTICDQISLKKP